MNPRSFPNTRGVLSEDETPEAINLSLESPESPEEAGAVGRSPSPDPTYEPEEEANMLLNQAETGAKEEPVEVKEESPVYVAPGWQEAERGGVEESQGKHEDPGPGGGSGRGRRAGAGKLQEPYHPQEEGKGRD